MRDSLHVLFVPHSTALGFPNLYDNLIVRDMTVPLSEIRLLWLYSDGAPSMRFRLSALVQSCWNGFAVLDRTSFY